MHNLRWDDLQFVLAVAEHGSLSGAARSLGVNHATVLRRIESVENRYGRPIFQRPPGGYRLRPDARDMLDALRSIERTAGRVERALRAKGTGIAGRMRLTTTDSVADLLLPRHLRALSAAYPRLQVDLAVTNRPLDMSQPEAELTLRPALRLPDGLDGQAAVPMHFAVYGAPGYLAERPDADLRTHRWLGVAPPLTRSPVGDWQEDRLDAPPALTADSFLTLARMAAEGLGLAMLPCFVGARVPGLVRAQGIEDALEVQVFVAAHPDLMRLDHVRTLAEFFTAALQSDRDLLAGHAGDTA